MAKPTNFAGRTISLVHPIAHACNFVLLFYMLISTSSTIVTRVNLQRVMCHSGGNDFQILNAATVRLDQWPDRERLGFSDKLQNWK